jgi:hypothetical protein
MHTTVVMGPDLSKLLNRSVFTPFYRSKKLQLCRFSLIKHVENKFKCSYQHNQTMLFQELSVLISGVCIHPCISLIEVYLIDVLLETRFRCGLSSNEKY